jgi:glycosyltransferase involved in cell wall biosynthesis
MNSGNPLVSVIIPVYNSEKYLGESITSVLAQTYQPIEIIIVNDGSTDGSEKIANKFSKQTSYFFQNNQGAAAARNYGVEKSNGDFISFLDADDLWESDKIDKQMKAFKSSEADMIFGNVYQFISPDVDSKSKIKLEESDKMLPGFVPGTLFMEKSSFQKVGPFNTSWSVGEFIDWYLHAQDAGLNHFMLSEIVMRRRIHSSNLGIRLKDMRTDYVKIIKASLDRRRQQSDQSS